MINDKVWADKFIFIDTFNLSLANARELLKSFDDYESH